MVDAFFLPDGDGDGFTATALTRGPWDKGSQHGGPPAALLAGAVEAALPPDFRLARMSIDILRPVPIGRVVPKVSVRAGRRVARGEAALEADGVEVMTATAMAQAIGDLADLRDSPTAPLPPPEEGRDLPFFEVQWDEGYHTAMTWRFLSGSFVGVGPSRLWMRQLVPLVAGEEPSPFQRTLVVADAGNGVSAAVDFARFSFVNPDLSVHLHRDPVGEWIGVEAHTTVHPTSAGLATTVLHDRTGPIGTGNQSLLIASATQATQATQPSQAS
jgi:hypothetical protein